MLVPLFVAILTSPFATPPPPAQSAKPLREVVYKASFTRREALQVERFGALPANASGHGTADEGTITVDVMAVAGNTLGVRLTERWTRSGHTLTYLGNVDADGTVNFGRQPISACSRDLLTFFGPLVAAKVDLVPGVSWIAKYRGKALRVSTVYSVAEIDGTVVTLDESQRVDVRSAAGGESRMEGWVTYKPSKLVPIAGRLTTLSRTSTPSGYETVQTIINFTRLSDTRDT